MCEKWPQLSQMGRQEELIPEEHDTWRCDFEWAVTNWKWIRAATLLKIEQIFHVISTSVHACEHSFMTRKNLKVLKLWHCLFSTQLASALINDCTGKHGNLVPEVPCSVYLVYMWSGVSGLMTLNIDDRPRYWPPDSWAMIRDPYNFELKIISRSMSHVHLCLHLGSPCMSIN